MTTVLSSIAKEMLWNIGQRLTASGSLQSSLQLMLCKGLSRSTLSQVPLEVGEPKPLCVLAQPGNRFVSFRSCLRAHARKIKDEAADAEGHSDRSSSCCGCSSGRLGSPLLFVFGCLSFAFRLFAFCLLLFVFSFLSEPASLFVFCFLSGLALLLAF